MIRADVIYLLAETPGKHGYFEPTVYTERMVYCTIRSVGVNEFYRAKEQGLEPDIVFTLAAYADYDGERLIKWNDKIYRVVRTYIDGLKIELTCEEGDYVATTG